MPRFFVEPVSGGVAYVLGQDAHHIARVLRMKIGEPLTLCDGKGMDYHCEIQAIEDKKVTAYVLRREPTASEPTVNVTLYQGLPKSEKMDWIVQKCVEIGITRVVPVAMARSIVRLKADEGAKKAARWQKIAAEAAGQSGRGIVPEVAAPITLKQAIAELGETAAVVFYEGGGVPVAQAVGANAKAVAIFIGPEGGFDPAEIEQLRAAGVVVATLGKRILRCETAPMVALSVIMQITGNMN